MSSLRILYIGSDGGTSKHRAQALERLGHTIHLVDPMAIVPHSRLLAKWVFETGGIFAERFVSNAILRGTPANRDFDLVHVDAGELVGASLVRELKRRYGRIVNYNHDDPFGSRDRRKWQLYLQAVAEYDLIVVVRSCNVGEARARQARKILLVWRTADEVAHAPREINDQDRRIWSSEVSFVGTFMPERGPFLLELIRRSIPLTIRGNRWERSPDWSRLRGHWRGPGIGEEHYARAVQCAQVSLGLLSAGNRDLHTTRSMEIPCLGGVLCAQRTSEHLALYEENVEAVFWDDAQECAEKCRELLSDVQRRARISQNGRNRCIRNNTLNEAVMDRIVRTAISGELPETNGFPNRSAVPSAAGV